MPLIVGVTHSFPPSFLLLSSSLLLLAPRSLSASSLAQAFTLVVSVSGRYRHRNTRLIYQHCRTTNSALNRRTISASSPALTTSTLRCTQLHNEPQTSLRRSHEFSGPIPQPCHSAPIQTHPDHDSPQHTHSTSSSSSYHVSPSKYPHGSSSPSPTNPPSGQMAGPTSCGGIKASWMGCTGSTSSCLACRGTG